MKCLENLHRLLMIATVLCLGFAPRLAMANKTDTLKGLTPGDLIGCNYTFQNGNPSIPCAKDVVAPDGTVSFLKPNAPFDNVEYFDVTTGKDVVELITPVNDPINLHLTSNTEYPIFSNPAGSFFDVFVEIQIEPFNGANLNQPGTFNIGETFDFTSGTSSTLPFVEIPGYTGTAVVSGFDVITTPEPSSLLMLAAGCFALRVQTRRSCR